MWTSLSIHHFKELIIDGFSEHSSYERQYCSYSLGSSGHSLKIVEICLEGLDNIQRVDDFSEVKKTIQEIQQYLVMKRSLGMYECVYGYWKIVELETLLSTGEDYHSDSWEVLLSF